MPTSPTRALATLVFQAKPSEDVEQDQARLCWVRDAGNQPWYKRQCGWCSFKGRGPKACDKVVEHVRTCEQNPEVKELQALETVVCDHCTFTGSWNEISPVKKSIQTLKKQRTKQRRGQNQSSHRYYNGCIGTKNILDIGVNKCMGICVVAYAFENEFENGGDAVKIVFTRCQAARVARRTVK